MSHSSLAALCQMLDYKKTFNHVDHKNLWETMAKSGSGFNFTKLVRGLVEGATSKIHANGLFLDEISMSWGVR